MDTALNEKYRQDAFRVFISGLKKSLRDVLLSSQPKDMPHAFALAEELDGNRERYNFAANYSKYGEYRDGQKKIIIIIGLRIMLPQEIRKGVISGQPLINLIVLNHWTLTVPFLVFCQFRAG